MDSEKSLIGGVVSETAIWQYIRYGESPVSDLQQRRELFTCPSHMEGRLKYQETL